LRHSGIYVAREEVYVEYPVIYWLASWRKVLDMGTIVKVWSVRAVDKEYAERPDNAPWCGTSHMNVCDLADSYKYKRTDGQWGALAPEYPAEAERNWVS
jgi:hypothetical protein